MNPFILVLLSLSALLRAESLDQVEVMRKVIDRMNFTEYPLVQGRKLLEEYATHSEVADRIAFNCRLNYCRGDDSRQERKEVCRKRCGEYAARIDRTKKGNESFAAKVAPECYDRCTSRCSSKDCNDTCSGLCEVRFSYEDRLQWEEQHGRYIADVQREIAAVVKKEM